MKSLLKSVFLVMTAVVILLFSLLSSTGAFANSETTFELDAKVFNIQVGDYIDPHNESLIITTLQKAIDEDYNFYIIELDSHGIAGGDLDLLADELSNSEITTAIWIGPASARYSNELDILINSVDIVGVAKESVQNSVSEPIVAPSLREFIAQANGFDNQRLGVVLNTGCGIEEIENAQSGDKCHGIEVSGEEQFMLDTPIKFEKLSPLANLAHSLINPSFAVGIMVLGLCLLVFEYYSASIGIASIGGISALIAGIYGFGYLPTNWWAIAIILVAILAFVVDVQAAGIGIYSAVGSVLFIIGSIFATTRGTNYQVSFLATAFILIMIWVFMFGAIPSLIRTRFGTPTIGREDFIGELAIAKGNISPTGSVKLRGASWKAKTNQATPIIDGQECRIVKISGIVLEVEPLVGAAKDYRE